MKFTQSQRKLHQPNYNPPCNVYQSTINTPNKILTGSLAPPTALVSLVNKNTFGYGSRFPADKRSMSLKNIGPGSYDPRDPRDHHGHHNDTLISRKQHTSQKPKHKIYKGNFIQIDNTPSIPYSYYGQNPDKQQLQYIKQLQLNTNLLQSYKKSSKSPNPSNYTFSKSHKQPSYIKVSHTSQQNQQILQMQQQENQHNRNNNNNNNNNNNEITSDNKPSLIWQNQIKKANNRRLQIIQNIGADYVPSLELIEIMKRRREVQNPGPTDYHPEAKNQYVVMRKYSKNKLTNQGITKAGNLSNQQDDQQYQYYEIPYHKKGVSFPTEKRFDDHSNINQIGPGHYKIKQQNHTKKSSQKYSFSRSNRELFPYQKVEGQFRFYRDIDGYGSNTGSSNQKKNNNKIPMKSSLSVKPDTGSHFTSSFNRDCPFGSSTVRFPEKKDDGVMLTLSEQRQIKNKEKISKMIRTRMILHKKLGINQDKDQGLLGISTMASTIDF